ncbi:MAG: hypothetical protein ACYC6L_10900 [Anaerolineae bacterium]
MSAVNDICRDLHLLLAQQTRYHFPFADQRLPHDGVYVLYEKGETAHGVDRIVRIGTHDGDGNLVQRLDEHFIKENKDRSVFRKNIGRALLAYTKDPFLAQWDIDRTSKAVRDNPKRQVDLKRLQQVERLVSRRIQEYFSFVIIPAPIRDDRHALEADLIATVAQCDECHPSSAWLGRYSPNEKIRSSGLWQVQHLDGQPMDADDVAVLRSLLE